MRLKPLPVVWFAAWLAIAVTVGCGYPKHIDPPLLTYDDTDTMVDVSAMAHAAEIKGRWYRVADTHSMEPLIKGGDRVVVSLKERSPYSERKVGEVIVYMGTGTDWINRTKDDPPICHRIVQIDREGMILSGDNNARTEARSRVTDENYIGLVVGIYRKKK